MQAIILAGGFGTRLQSLVHRLPKPMAPVASRPFLSWLLEFLYEEGISEAALCLHHLPQEIRAYFGPRFGAMRLHYYIEHEPLGTGGALREAMRRLDPGAPVLALNGDSLVDVDCRAMMRRHRAQGRRLTLATRRVPDCSRYSQLAFEGDTVTRFDLLGRAAPGDISAGFYVLSPDVFEGFDLPPAFSLERDFLAKHTPQLMPGYYKDVDYFIDIGVPEDYRRAQTEVPQLLGLRLAA